VREATRALSREVLDNLAVRESARGDWDQLVCGDETRQELATLEARCRQREDLAQRVGPALSNSLNAGVRALLKGPSGTGKTLAARVLANVLGMDLYRVDLSAVVNKYIGETEKNLHRIFSRAEELDVMLLFDEGDALLGRRTNVQTANDRYANLETNFLLQRIESHEGIVLITSNAAEHIDTAFQRRMDVVIEFRAPGAAERLDIWQLHLPPQHGLPEPFLDEVAQRCALTGGQIRNAVLHAALLSASGRGRMAQAHLESAIRREYRKLGTVCPLRQAPRLALSGI
jgi:SpoVK/Ycf46/Vps4 family AAA+-type ATPase